MLIKSTSKFCASKNQISNLLYSLNRIFFKLVSMINMVIYVVALSIDNATNLLVLRVCLRLIYFYLMLQTQLKWYAREKTLNWLVHGSIWRD